MTWTQLSSSGTHKTDCSEITMVANVVEEKNYNYTTKKAPIGHNLRQTANSPARWQYGHVTSSGTWLFDTPVAISYRCSVVTDPLSQTVFKIFGRNTMFTNRQTNTRTNQRTRRIALPPRGGNKVSIRKLYNNLIIIIIVYYAIGSGQ